MDLDPETSTCSIVLVPLDLCPRPADKTYMSAPVLAESSSAATVRWHYYACFPKVYVQKFEVKLTCRECDGHPLQGGSRAHFFGG